MAASAMTADVMGLRLSATSPPSSAQPTIEPEARISAGFERARRRRVSGGGQARSLPCAALSFTVLQGHRQSRCAVWRRPARRSLKVRIAVGGQPGAGYALNVRAILGLARQRLFAARPGNMARTAFLIIRPRDHAAGVGHPNCDFRVDRDQGFAFSAGWCRTTASIAAAASLDR